MNNKHNLSYELKCKLIKANNIKKTEEAEERQEEVSGDTESGTRVP